MPYPYTKRQSIGGEAQPIANTNFPYVSNQTTSGTPAASSVITFNANTTAIEVAAGNTAIALKWGSASVIAAAGTANYDHIIPVNTYRRFVIPVSVIGTSPTNGMNVMAGLYQSAALIAVSSVITGVTEY